MAKDMFDYVFEKNEDVIKRQDTRLRKSISPRERLAVTLRYLATGESFTSLSYNYRIGATTIGLIVKDVCAAIRQTMQPEFMKVPSTSDDWREVANGFKESWQFPNFCGAVDGKHWGCLFVVTMEIILFLDVSVFFVAWHVAVSAAKGGDC
ncbi:protein ANTAGONIST OF LIKE HETEROCHROMATIN PROTEIN 1-like [Haliotis rufescens]|uniref:protein ANTAGONIST OF LIKE HETEROCHROMATIN PROTEIN 1-like n=1 Tax=Haliotis rufescens TaxID=6454 RepID=UPI00201F5CD9|nr:protein ANTAGONIST OF LIKE HETEROCHROMATIN PROTEIN 1-like [Haliotis rufescens]